MTAKKKAKAPFDKHQLNILKDISQLKNFSKLIKWLISKDHKNSVNMVFISG
jgi:hypothetical protein